MIWIVLSVACAHVSFALLFAAWITRRQVIPSLPVVPVCITPMKAANENESASATRRFVALDAIAACRDSASNTETRRCRASFLEAAIAAQLAEDRQRESIA